MKYHLTLVKLKWLSLRRQEVTSVDKDVVKRKPLRTAGGNINQVSHDEKQYKVSSKKININYHMIQQFHFQSHIQRKYKQDTRKIPALPCLWQHYSQQPKVEPSMDKLIKCSVIIQWNIIQPLKRKEILTKGTLSLSEIKSITKR